MKVTNRIYLDYNSTTGVDPRVAEFMYSLDLLPYNPSSVHYFGRMARKLVEEARLKIAHSLNVSLAEYDIIFTASGTEANNIALKSFDQHQIIISPIEHLSILNTAKELSDPLFVKISVDGLVDMEHLESLLKKNDHPKIVSIMLANNETGVIQNILQIEQLVHKYGYILHSDAVQAYGKIAINMKDLNLDVLTISAHKIGGPLGAGALIFKKNLNLKPLIIGGGQEKNLRSGTENVNAIYGFGKAAELVEEKILSMKRIKKLRDYLEAKIAEQDHSIVFFSSKVNRIPNTSCIEMPGVTSETQIINFDCEDIAVSSGSACSSGKVSTSHVLLAMGATIEQAKCTIRVSLGYKTAEPEIDKFLNTWSKIYNKHLSKMEVRA